MHNGLLPSIIADRDIDIPIDVNDKIDDLLLIEADRVVQVQG